MVTCSPARLFLPTTSRHRSRTRKLLLESLLDMTDAGYQRVMGINLHSALICAQEFARAVTDWELRRYFELI